MSSNLTYTLFSLENVIIYVILLAFSSIWLVNFNYCHCDCRLRFSTFSRRRIGTRNEFNLPYFLWNFEQFWLGYIRLLDSFCLYQWLWRLLTNTLCVSKQFNLYKCIIGFVNTFLSWKGFMPLGRLTFTAYLIHQDFLQVYDIGFSRMPFYYTKMNLVTKYFVVLVASFMMAFVGSIAIEMPFINLGREFLTSKSGQNQSKYKF